MDEKQREAFYVGAAVFLHLDSDEVDDALAKYELSVEKDSVAVCREAIRSEYPERYEAGKRSHYRQLIFGDPDMQ